MRAYLFYYISKHTSLMIYERGEYYSTSTAASENSHGGHPILLENGVHWQWFDSDPGPLSSLAASTFPSHFKNYEKPE